MKLKTRRDRGFEEKAPLSASRLGGAGRRDPYDSWDFDGNEGDLGDVKGRGHSGGRHNHAGRGTWDRNMDDEGNGGLYGLDDVDSVEKSDDSNDANK
ncbi:TPA: hypothetical protein HA251_01725 [Candidatus Woesearchaeota archaeon]|nr:hypothetical protein [Candidatus Woesearchaeota archaeon]